MGSSGPRVLSTGAAAGAAAPVGASTGAGVAGVASVQIRQRLNGFGLILGAQGPDLTTSPIEATWPRRNVRNACSPAGVSSDKSGLSIASTIFCWIGLQLLLPVGGGGVRGQQHLRQLALGVADLAVAVLHLRVQLLHRVGGAAGLLLVGGQRRSVRRGGADGSGWASRGVEVGPLGWRVPPRSFFGVSTPPWSW